MKKKTIIAFAVLLISAGLVWRYQFRNQYPIPFTSFGPDVASSTNGPDSSSMSSESQTASTPNALPGSQPGFVVNNRGNTSLRPQVQNSLTANSLPTSSGLRVDQSVSPLKGKTDAERWTWWRQHVNAKDVNFMYRIPISFFGKVVDDAENPIQAATVEIVINIGGDTPKYELQTDAAGLFSVTGKTGKSLSARVSKEGYQPYTAKNHFHFDYVMFMEPDYYEPDPGNPVVFYLRKNQPAEFLVYRHEQEASLDTGQQKAFFIGASRDVRTSPQIVVELLSNGPAREKAWSARLTVPGGGLILTIDEFPFDAPADGYVSSFDLDDNTAHPKSWPGGSGGMFYVKTPFGYGRVIVTAVPGKPWVYMTSYFNPSGSTNLEWDPNLRIPLSQ